VRLAWNILVLAALVFDRSAIDGQSLTSSAQRSVFRTGVDVIALNVTVMDGSNRYVTDLGPHDFRVFEDGRSQRLTFFQKTGVPLALALLLDTSASMEQTLDIAQEAAIGFTRQLGPADVASVIDFDSTVHILQDFTNDRDTLEGAIRRTVAEGSTALFNAVYIALKELSKAPAVEQSSTPRRLAIVVVSDGEDTSSLVAFDELLDLAIRADTAIYAIGLGTARGSPVARDSQGPQFVLRRLAQQTGGRAFFPSEAKDLSTVYGEIKAELSSQYSLAYESNNPRRDGRFRHIAVRVDRTGVVARTRPGYYAPTR
jgi:Ca-activated chloride channel family protein